MPGCCFQATCTSQLRYLPNQALGTTAWCDCGDGSPGDDRHPGLRPPHSWLLGGWCANLGLQACFFSWERGQEGPFPGRILAIRFWLRKPLSSTSPVAWALMGRALVLPGKRNKRPPFQPRPLLKYSHIPLLFKVWPFCSRDRNASGLGVTPSIPTFSSLWLFQMLPTPLPHQLPQRVLPLSWEVPGSANAAASLSPPLPPPLPPPQPLWVLGEHEDPAESRVVRGWGP